jgi:hypothetical protein
MEKVFHLEKKLFKLIENGLIKTMLKMKKIRTICGIISYNIVL